MDLVVGPLGEPDVPAADSIFRTAFATYFGLPDPSKMFGDSNPFGYRFHAPNTKTLGAWMDGRLAGSSIVTRWGSFGFIGPLTVSPDLWDKGIAKALLVGTQAILDSWRVTHRGLFTFSHSAKHIALYQRFGYWPRYLTPIFERTLSAEGGTVEVPGGVRLFSSLMEGDRALVLDEIREVAGTLLTGLDLSGEVLGLDALGRGDTLLLSDEERLIGFACCHQGAGSETESGSTYVKFACVRRGTRTDDRLERLLAGIEWLARAREELTVQFGVNATHRDVTRTVVDRGYRSNFVGVAMHSPDEAGYHRPEFAVLDDWR